ncbi:GAF domain-containing protein [Bradyrhizobium liaoningense]|uniref:GAF domain-containing protein n=1 Tax=Bradyrhizobium liaoningense TaxID=43992 RepID=UPI001BAE0F79|nr:GAF domain-containing protein [Bradyrhizobium liaoningense]MBR0714772.1 GAF domain-containing protein [Bradyrhizobium liaoningense]
MRERDEALEQYRATSEVLRVISNSPTNLQPVFDTIVKFAPRLCGANHCVLYRFDGELLHLVAHHNLPGELLEMLRRLYPMRPSRMHAAGRAIMSAAVVEIADTLSDPEYQQKVAVLGGWRSMVAAPVLRNAIPIGIIVIQRAEAGKFPEGQIALLKTFADQAAIAIENVRLFDEVQTRTRELARSVEELRALGEVTQAVNSTVDLETVLTTIAVKAAQLSSTEAGAIYVFDDAKQEFRLRATYGLDDAVVAQLKRSHLGLRRPLAISDAVKRRAPIQIPNLQDDPSAAVDIIVRAGFRALLVVPLLSVDRIVGALVVRRKQPGEFPKSIIELLQTFAGQSVLAIQNARLFESVEARTRELTASLEDLRTTQDRLVQTQKLASLGQLTAGIAHEIKNPLNFVNNFSALSSELTDELNNVLIKERLSPEGREEVDELTRLLKENLEKVAQHGKRADSIVKSMLLHSRESSGERRSADINALVQESLNLAYHGARAEKADFSITLKHELDPNAGALNLYPQEMIRALLNLVSNGFYAANKRKIEAGDEAFEPVVSAATRNLGKTVEIRIRDNGTGIPPEVREKMFNPFFTTKPTGEGTGLGLSMTHDIIVKQHGARIDVETKLGEFTEVIITLPRDRLATSGMEPE